MNSTKEQELARRVLREAGRGSLKADRVDAVLSSARLAGGVEPTQEEQSELRGLIAGLRREKKELEGQRARVSQLGARNATVWHMAPVLGPLTATVLFAALGDPTEYESSGAYLKAVGLNLRERSSGQHHGQLKITKRGPGHARRYVYFAALRLIDKNEVVRAWYERKVARDGGKKMKAVVAVMRKLIRAMPHVAKGEVFDATKLFDVSRLELAKVA
jgi:transposase